MGELFSEEELRGISGLKRGGDYVEVTCGCTSYCYGDAVGRLRVYLAGDLEISCECTPGCQEDKLTPAAFEKHSGRETARKWKNNVWVIVNGEKVPVSKTALLKYYDQASKTANSSSRSRNGKLCHRDEFLRCTRCNKERRFRLRTKEECRVYHDALAYICHLTMSHVMMMKNGPVAKFTGAVYVHQHAGDAPPVCVLGVNYVASQAAAARLASTSSGMLKLEPYKGKKEIPISVVEQNQLSSNP
ncbi:hypothetical protein RJ641_017419 [Dillenia turbinata]|uniref:SAND domain-containing protein n=1 Tax=Dillenia turbinata TaxID=194707 RepID=A0AAN8UY21_9MAGN